MVLNTLLSNDDIKMISEGVKTSMNQKSYHHIQIALGGWQPV